MDDTIRDTWRNLNSKGEEKPAAAPSEKQQAPKPNEPGRERDEHGRFKPKAGEPAAVPQEPGQEQQPKPEGEQAEAPDGEQQQTPTEPKPHDKPPSSWKREATAEWEKLPETVRAEIHRREADFHRGVEQYKGAAQWANSIWNEMRPYEAMMRARNLEPVGVIKDLMATAYTLQTGSPQEKAALMLQVAEQYGVDWNVAAEVAQKRHAGQPVVDPAVQALQNELAELRQHIAAQREQSTAATRAELQREADAFFADPKHEFANVVRNDMAALIETGRANGLNDAYEQAIWLNPETRAKLLARQREADRKSEAERAASARQASAANVQTQGSLPAKTPVGTMEDTIRQTLRRLNVS